MLQIHSIVPGPHLIALTPLLLYYRNTDTKKLTENLKKGGKVTFPLLCVVVDKGVQDGG